MNITARIQTVRHYLVAHKFITLIALAAIIGGGYWAYTAYASSSNETRYVLGSVREGTIVASVTGSGQVAASDETDMKAKASGDIVSVTVKEGQGVQQGQVIAYIDSTDAQRAVADAELAVEEAKINLEHDTLQAPIDYKALQTDVDRKKRDLAHAYEDAYAALADAFISLPDIVAGADSLLYDKTIDPTTQNVSTYKNLFISVETDQQTVRSYANTAETDYSVARDSYAKSAVEFKKLTRSSSTEEIGGALSDAQNTATALSKAVVSEANLIDTVIDILKRRDWNIDSDITAAQGTVRGYVSDANSVLTSLTAAEKALTTAEDSLEDAEHELELAAVGNPSGAEPFDLKLAQNALKQKEAALLETRRELANHVIRAPFDGVIAELTIRRGESVSTGGAVGSLITNQKIAELSLNEVDAAKIEVGDKTQLTFDALDGVTITGEVASIDPKGTVTQGVVSYAVKIGFDAQDDRIKPSMTVNAVIQIETKNNVLIVPSSAIKSDASGLYVLAFTPPLEVDERTQGGIVSAIAPTRIPVETGIADDSRTEILSGLSKGQQIVTRTVTSTSNTTTTTNTTTNRSSGFRGPGGGIVP